MTIVRETSLPGLPVRRGKVRDVYDLGDRLLLVSTDRISAFDWVLAHGHSRQGAGADADRRLLVRAARRAEPSDHHRRRADGPAAPAPIARMLAGRSTLCRKTEVVPIECVVRGYLAGSGWKEYQQSGTVCGIKLPAGLTESDQLPEPIFTPATKAATGHDENISFERMVEIVGRELAEELRRREPADLPRAGRSTPGSAASSSPTRSSSSAGSAASCC